MIKRIFISYSFSNREKYRQFHKELVEYFSGKSIDVYAFVFDNHDKLDNKTMMKDALKEIDNSDFLLAEVSDESVGVGLEVGYAKAKGKKTGYLYKQGSKYDNVVAGTVDSVIEYSSSKDVITWFETYTSN